MEGMPDPDARMEEIRQVAGDSIEAMTPAVVVPAVLSYQCRGTWMTRQVRWSASTADAGQRERFQPLPAAPGEPARR